MIDIPEIAAAPRTRFQGLELPERFSTLEQECRVLRQGAAISDGSLRAWVRLRGEDRVDFLQGMVSNDVRNLALGEGTYAALLNQQGRVVTDLRIHAAGDHFVLDLPAHAAATARAALEKYVVADDVEMEDDGAVLIGLEGPGAAALLAGVAAGVRVDRLSGAVIAGREARVAPASQGGEVGVLIAVAAVGAATVWDALRAAGAEPIGFAALDVLRIEAGIPWVGVDMDEDVLVMEADLEAALSFKKGCYLGQEVVERIAARGHVNRRRTGLVFDGGPVAARTPLLAADKDVGWVTSSVRSPGLGKTIGMGYVRREQLEPGTPLSVPGGGAAVVATLPFARR